MAKRTNVAPTTTKNTMVKVRCPKLGNAVVWANVGPKSGARCTACGLTGHDKAA